MLLCACLILGMKKAALKWKLESDQPQLLLTCGSSPARKLKFTALDKDMLCTIQSAASRRFLMQYCASFGIPAWQKICYQRQRNWPTLMTWFQMNGSLQWIFLRGLTKYKPDENFFCSSEFRIIVKGLLETAAGIDVIGCG